MKISMIVDNSPVIKKVARLVFEKVGYAVCETKDGMEALEACRDNMPDMLMVDWNMPGINGIEFIREFHLLDRSGQTKVMFCTSGITPGEILRTKHAGYHGYILKPFTREILENELSRINA